MKRVMLLFALLLAAFSVAADNWLFRYGQSDYAIVVSAGASSSERYAAEELSDYVCQMSGVRLPVVDSPRPVGKHVYVGYSKWVAKLTGEPCPADTAETFVYRTIGNDVVIYGGRQAGTAFGVYAFLERELGIRWYSADYTKVPQRSRYKLPSLNRKESPVFRYRHVMYYQMHHNMSLNVHNRLNMRFAEWLADEHGGRLDAFWGGHTFDVLLPAAAYFDKHPEYFSLRKGRRVKEGQLCLSNPAVIRLLKQRMIQIVRENPGYVAYNLTQNDNMLFCECKGCQALAKRFGSQAGLLLWAVNQVAEAVETEIPGTDLATFAYQYTRKAPRGIKPRHNVIIRLCDIECCFLHPVEGTSENAPFMDDLKEWSRLTSRLHMFDYVTGFWQFMVIFPNFHVMAQNLQTFSRHHVTGVLELGQYQSNGGEFAEMKQWMLAKLLWNPNQRIDELARQFIFDYYGAGANDVWKYYKMCCQLVKPDRHAKFDVNHFNELYTDEFAVKGRSLLEHAVEATKADTVVCHRVEQVLGQVLYLQVVRHPEKSTIDGTAKRLFRLVKRDKINVRENLPPEEYLRQSGYI